MYRKILLAYNGTPQGRAALRQGAEVAVLCKAQVCLLAVMDLPVGVLLAEGVEPSGLSDKERAEVEGILLEGVQRLRQRWGLDAEGRLAFGNPAEQICAMGREIGADLIVVGHHNKGALARWWSGSVGNSILGQAPCSILVAVSHEG